MVQPEAWYGKPLQIHGFAKNVSRKRDSLEYSFEIHRQGQVLRATYTDATQSHVTTVGLLFTDADAAAIQSLTPRVMRHTLRLSPLGRELWESQFATD